MNEKNAVWGWSTHLDMFECDLERMKDAIFIRKFVEDLCLLIDMKRFGECQVIHFGEGNKEGFSMVQLIETSNLVAHFANDIQAIYFDIFSCKEYNAQMVVEFCTKSFGAKTHNVSMLNRKTAS